MIKYQTIENKDGTKSFQYRYRKINGKQTTISFKAKNTTKTAEKAALKDLLNYAKELEAEKALGLAKDESTMRFSECADITFELRDKDAADQTKQNRRYYLRIVNEHLGNIKLKELSATKIEKFLVKMSKTKSRQVLSKYKQIISIVMDYAFSKDLVASNPMLKVKYEISQKNLKEVKPVDVDDFKKYLEVAKQNRKYYYGLLLMFYTGMRIGEVLALRFDDWDFDKGIIHITKNRQKNGKLGPVKKDRNRIIPIHKKLEELYEDVQNWNSNNKKLLEQDYENNYLFIAHEDGRFISYTAFKENLRRLDDKMFRLRPHQLRHTFATFLDNISLKDLQAIGGWKDANTVINIYQAHIGYKSETIESLNYKFKDF